MQAELSKGFNYMNKKQKMDGMRKLSVILDSDPEVVASMPIERVRESLQHHGIKMEAAKLEVTQMIHDLLKGKQNAAPVNQPSLHEKVHKWAQTKVRNTFAFFDLQRLSMAGNEMFCGDATQDETDQRIINLLDKYGEAELNEKLPWAAHRVVIMKVPVEESNEVYYRALIEQREGETAKNGSLKIVLHAGEHTDKVKLEFDFPNRTFPKSVPANAPVSFEPILE
jgi:hypothetical protein